MFNFALKKEDAVHDHQEFVFIYDNMNWHILGANLRLSSKVTHFTCTTANLA